jgi:hypothetical protein
VPTTHDFPGRKSHLFWHSISLKKDSPLHHVQRTYEIQGPFRISYTHIYRIPFTRKGIAIGYWLDENVSGHHASLAGRVNDQLQATSDAHMLDAIDGATQVLTSPSDVVQEAQEVPDSEFTVHDESGRELAADDYTAASELLRAGDAGLHGVEEFRERSHVTVTVHQEPLQQSSGGGAFE